MAGNNGEVGRSVASKVFAVLDAFAGVEGTLRLTEIVERTGLPMPTALRMVRELVEWGGLERHSDGSYRIGEHMWSVGTLVVVSQPSIARGASPIEGREDYRRRRRDAVPAT